MIASIRDKEAWILEKEEEIQESLGGACHEEIETIARKWAEEAYNDTMADYAESRGER